MKFGCVLKIYPFGEPLIRGTIRVWGYIDMIVAAPSPLRFE